MDHSEVSELSLVEKLKEPSDFQLWTFKVNILFKSQGLYSIVCGEVKAPEQGSSDYAAYVKNDAKAQKIIITPVDRIPLTHILTCENAFSMYCKLCDIYERDALQQKFYLMQEFFGYRYTAGVDLVTHVSKLDNLVFRLKILGNDIPENMLISRILTTLPERYSYFNSAWESTPVESKTVANLTARLIAKEKTSADSRTETDVVAFKAVMKKCYKCGSDKHLVGFHKTDAASKKQGVSAVKCFSYQKTRHMAWDFPIKVKNCSICKKNQPRGNRLLLPQKHEQEIAGYLSGGRL
ncbi:hypothetical protein PR048_004943 [Dryococelus australis]|uniref:Polyprotein n=1 Tax=Dryococelus australis TaxID=614101 RepID=A0ABQ9I6U8_9NEOP|nr:hypothetical protein PR048_004943 [Dryococelus australis]